MITKSLLKSRRLVLLLMITGGLAFFSQKDLQRILIKTKADKFSLDNFGNVYTVHGDELMKFLADGKFFARYSNLKLGDIQSVDATNPLKILLYYRDFQQIVFLDNQLSVNSDPISMEKLDCEQAELVCASANNGFWIYNKQNNELIRFAENLKRTASTGNLKQLLQNDLKPNFMVEHNNFLFLNSPTTGIFMFDIYGTFSKIISIKGLKEFQIAENIIYFNKDSLLCSYNHRNFEEQCRELKAPVAATIKYQNKRVYMAYKDSIVSVRF